MCFLDVYVWGGNLSVICGILFDLVIILIIFIIIILFIFKFKFVLYGNICKCFRNIFLLF